MKKLFASLLCAMLLLAPVQGILAEAAPATFADQCEAAGIPFQYEDPNAGMYDFTTTDAAVDVKTHASGVAKYVKEDEGPCIRTPMDLVARGGARYQIYDWVADEEKGVATLAEAAALPDAKFVERPFPNDGAKYALKVKKNSLGTKVVCTVNEDGTPNAAIFGMGMRAHENGKDAYFAGAIMAETATFRNLLRSSDLLIVYYEYNPTSEAKIGVGTRNAGARVYCQLDEEQSILFTKATETAESQKLTVAEYRALPAEEQQKLEFNYISVMALMTEIDSIG